MVHWGRLYGVGPGADTLDSSLRGSICAEPQGEAETMGGWKDILHEQWDEEWRVERLQEQTEGVWSALHDTTGGGPFGDGRRHPGFVVHNPLDFGTYMLICVDGPGAEAGGSRVWFRFGDVDRVYIDIRKHDAEWEAYLTDVNANLGGGGLQHLFVECRQSAMRSHSRRDR